MKNTANLLASESANVWFQVEKSENFVKFSLLGFWELDNVEAIYRSLSKAQLQDVRVVVDGRGLRHLDTAGAMLLYHFLESSGVDVREAEFRNFDKRHLDIARLVASRLEQPEEFHSPICLSLLERLGQNALRIFSDTANLTRFIGESSYELARTAKRPKFLRLKELFVQLELGFVNAIPVVSLVTFLVGVVIAYLFAIQIEKYGANIFIVDAVALAMCRELSPMIVAIIMAGRSGSAFTAHLGAMKLNEEIDAMITIGLSPMRVLVVPRFLALVIAMPLLVFVGDAIGIIGGMLIADLRLGITGVTYLERLQVVLPVKSLVVGLVKAPVFAAFIAVIGCRMGFSVENNARSVGLSTTSTVVQSIVSVIIINAVFAVIFVELGI
ncbi:MAG: ABC transporter permease [Deltaproteobacteria bacterium]|nr:ABC transporter permease [Deltaproteobacteria bacterium]